MIAGMLARMTLEHDGPVELPNLTASLSFEQFRLDHAWTAYLAEADVPRYAENVDDNVHHFQQGSGNAYA
jgi:hypothetical protein